MRAPFVVALVLLLCSVSALAQPDKIEWYGSQGGARHAGVMVTRTQQEWQDLWHEALRVEPPRPLPADMRGVAVFLGPRRTGGYEVQVSGVDPGECLDIVNVVEHVPGPNAIVIQAFTAPWIIALIPASNRPVAFRRTAPNGDSRLIIPDEEGARLAQMGEACAALRGR
jgi:hypothetical protein